jgi:hypothetical protein
VIKGKVKIENISGETKTVAAGEYSNETMTL